MYPNVSLKQKAIVWKTFRKFHMEKIQETLRNEGQALKFLRSLAIKMSYIEVYVRKEILLLTFGFFNVFILSKLPLLA